MKKKLESKDVRLLTAKDATRMAHGIEKLTLLTIPLSDLILLRAKSASARTTARLEARWAARDLRGKSALIAAMARGQDRQFFIELGRCLSGEIDIEYFDQMDRDIVEIILANPAIKAKDAIRELQKLNHPCITEENFRNRKKRLRITDFIRILPTCVFEKDGHRVIEFRKLTEAMIP